MRQLILQLILFVNFSLLPFASLSADGIDNEDSLLWFFSTEGQMRNDSPAGSLVQFDGPMRISPKIPQNRLVSLHIAEPFMLRQHFNISPASAALSPGQPFHLQLQRPLPSSWISNNQSGTTTTTTGTTTGTVLTLTLQAQLLPSALASSSRQSNHHWNGNSSSNDQQQKKQQEKGGGDHEMVLRVERRELRIRLLPAIEESVPVEAEKRRPMFEHSNIRKQQPLVATRGERNCSVFKIDLPSSFSSTNFSSLQLLGPLAKQFSINSSNSADGNVEIHHKKIDNNNSSSNNSSSSIISKFSCAPRLGNGDQDQQNPPPLSLIATFPGPFGSTQFVLWSLVEEAKKVDEANAEESADVSGSGRQQQQQQQQQQQLHFVRRQFDLIFDAVRRQFVPAAPILLGLVEPRSVAFARENAVKFELARMATAVVAGTAEMNHESILLLHARTGVLSIENIANLLAALEATNPLHFMATLLVNGTALDRANLTLGLDEKSLAKAGSKKKARKREEMIRFEKSIYAFAVDPYAVVANSNNNNNNNREQQHRIAIGRLGTKPKLSINDVGGGGDMDVQFVVSEGGGGLFSFDLASDHDENLDDDDQRNHDSGTSRSEPLYYYKDVLIYSGPISQFPRNYTLKVLLLSGTDFVDSAVVHVLISGIGSAAPEFQNGFQRILVPKYDLNHSSSSSSSSTAGGNDQQSLFTLSAEDTDPDARLVYALESAECLTAAAKTGEPLASSAAEWRPCPAGTFSLSPNGTAGGGHWVLSLVAEEPQQQLAEALVNISVRDEAHPLEQKGHTLVLLKFVDEQKQEEQQRGINNDSSTTTGDIDNAKNGTLAGSDLSQNLLAKSSANSNSPPPKPLLLLHLPNWLPVGSLVYSFGIPAAVEQQQQEQQQHQQQQEWPPLALALASGMRMRVRYALAGAGSHLRYFRVGRESGLLTTALPLRNISGRHQLTVEATLTPMPADGTESANARNGNANAKIGNANSANLRSSRVLQFPLTLEINGSTTAGAGDSFGTLPSWLDAADLGAANFYEFLWAEDGNKSGGQWRNLSSPENISGIEFELLLPISGEENNNSTGGGAVRKMPLKMAANGTLMDFVPSLDRMLSSNGGERFAGDAFLRTRTQSGQSSMVPIRLEMPPSSSSSPFSRQQQSSLSSLSSSSTSSPPPPQMVPNTPVIQLPDNAPAGTFVLSLDFAKSAKSAENGKSAMAVDGKGDGKEEDGPHAVDVQHFRIRPLDEGNSSEAAAKLFKIEAKNGGHSILVRTAVPLRDLVAELWAEQEEDGTPNPTMLLLPLEFALLREKGAEAAEEDQSKMSGNQNRMNDSSKLEKAKEEMEEEEVGRFSLQIVPSASCQPRFRHDQRLGFQVDQEALLELTDSAQWLPVGMLSSEFASPQAPRGCEPLRYRLNKVVIAGGRGGGKRRDENDENDDENDNDEGRRRSNLGVEDAGTDAADEFAAGIRVDPLTGMLAANSAVLNMTTGSSSRGGRDQQTAEDWEEEQQRPPITLIASVHSGALFSARTRLQLQILVGGQQRKVSSSSSSFSSSSNHRPLVWANQSPLLLQIEEGAPAGTLLSTVRATMKGKMMDGQQMGRRMRYRLEGPDTDLLAVGPENGELRTLRELDYEALGDRTLPLRMLVRVEEEEEEEGEQTERNNRSRDKENGGDGNEAAAAAGFHKSRDKENEGDGNQQATSAAAAAGFHKSRDKENEGDGNEAAAAAAGFLVGGEGQQQLELEVQLDIVDINDNNPTFVRSTYDFVVEKMAPVGQLLGRVEATDADQCTKHVELRLLACTFHFGRFARQISPPNRHFLLDRWSGKISLNAPVDDSPGGHFILTLEARDDGGRRSVQNSTVNIWVADASDIVSVALNRSPVELDGAKVEAQLSSLASATGLRPLLHEVRYHLANNGMAEADDQMLLQQQQPIRRSSLLQLVWLNGTRILTFEQVEPTLRELDLRLGGEEGRGMMESFEQNLFLSPCSSESGTIGTLGQQYQHRSANQQQHQQHQQQREHLLPLSLLFLLLLVTVLAVLSVLGCQHRRRHLASRQLAQAAEAVRRSSNNGGTMEKKGGAVLFGGQFHRQQNSGGNWRLPLPPPPCLPLPILPPPPPIAAAQTVVAAAAIERSFYAAAAAAAASQFQQQQIQHHHHHHRQQPSDDYYTVQEMKIAL